jgi:hypothetical protein
MAPAGDPVLSTHLTVVGFLRPERGWLGSPGVRCWTLNVRFPKRRKLVSLDSKPYSLGLTKPKLAPTPNIRTGRGAGWWRTWAGEADRSPCDGEHTTFLFWGIVSSHVPGKEAGPHLPHVDAK